MQKDPITIKELEEYLAGELTQENRAEFEKRLQEDETAKEQFIQLRKVIEGLKGYAFKEKLKEFHKELFPPDNNKDIAGSLEESS